MRIESTVFENGGMIPSKYTCDGDGLNPPLVIADVPEGTKSLALIVEDPDAPMGLWVHWIIWNIPPSDMTIEEAITPPGVIGKSTSGARSWDPICPPDREHRYYFKIYALDSEIYLDPEIAIKQDMERMMEGHIIEQAELMGRYSRVILA